MSWRTTRAGRAGCRATVARAARSASRWLATHTGERRLHDATRTALVVAPHPDDETFGCGGVLALKRAAGTHVVVLVATDGELSDRVVGRTPGDTAAARRTELRRATAALGLEDSAVELLRLPDGSLEDRLDELTAAIRDALERHRPEQLFVCAEADRHPDHVACHTAAVLALQGRDDVELLGYPVWSWLSWPWIEPRAAGAAGRAARLLAPVSVLWRQHPVTVDISAVRARKEAAIDAYASQVGDGSSSPFGGLPSDLVDLFRSDVEIFLRPRRGPRA